MGAALHAWEREDRQAEFAKRGFETPEQLASHIEDVQDRTDTKFIETSRSHIEWSNQDARLAGAINPNTPEASTVMPCRNPDRQLNAWVAGEKLETGVAPDVQDGPIPLEIEPVYPAIEANTAASLNPDKVREDALEQRAKAEEAYAAAEERLAALQADNAPEADIEVADAECIKLSGAVRDIDYTNIRDAARDPTVLPLFDSMAEEIGDLRDEYAADNERLAVTADVEGWDSDRRADESSKLEASWDSKLDSSYPLSDGQITNVEASSGPQTEPGLG